MRLRANYKNMNYLLLKFITDSAVLKINPLLPLHSLKILLCLKINPLLPPRSQELVDREKDPDEYYETISVHTDASSTSPGKGVKKSDSITRIYACATMWHETKGKFTPVLSPRKTVKVNH